jgi:hypothetical protein
MTKFRIDTYQHLVGEMWIYTPHVNSNPFNCKDTTPPIAVNIEIFDVYMMSMRSLKVFYLSTSSSLWELVARM